MIKDEFIPIGIAHTCLINGEELRIEASIHGFKLPVYNVDMNYCFNCGEQLMSDKPSEGGITFVTPAISNK